ncbi:V-type ATP synthase subunit F [Candidatus Izemoplasma sp. B36]|uniref:V-type ATP synthase subunit F n=1 Tax=Candidatus Izemoplasma sp. B36 TaxID=3242468 RepID=UPI0035571533
MKFFLLTDNTDTLMGMRLVGIEGVVIHERKRVIEELDKAVNNEAYAILLITTKLVELCPDIISELKLKLKKPIILEIPDRHGSTEVGKSIDNYVSDAIGVKLRGD